MKKPEKLSNKNDFLESARANKGHLKSKQKMSTDIKNHYIRDLEERNRKLKYQIIKINEKLQEQKEKEKQEVKKDFKLKPHESSQSALKKQLKNVYKHISNYEKEIKAVEQKQAGGQIVEKMSRLQNILQQKNDYLQKIKGELTSLSKHSMSNVRRLKNNAGKDEMEKAMISYNEQIKMLRQRLKILQAKLKKKKENAKKQFDYVKKVESQLLEEGFSVHQIEQLKQRKKQYLDEVLNQQKGNKEQDKEEQIKIKQFNEMKNEIKLLKKLHQEYERKIVEMEENKKLGEEEGIALSQKIQQKNFEIQEIHDQIQEYRVKISKVNIKPIYSYPRPQPKEKKEKPLMLPSLIKKTQSQKSVIEVLPIKYDEKGQVTENGKRFTDRTLLGKRTDVRIIGVKVWTQKSTFSISGIQCIYLIGDQKQKKVVGTEHIHQDIKKNCSQNTIDIEQGDYVRTVSGHLNTNNHIQYLIFLTKKRVVGRFGLAKQNQKQFNFNMEENEVPVCMYGSIVRTKDSETKKETTFLENLGFQICKDKSYKKQDKFRV